MRKRIDIITVGLFLTLLFAVPLYWLLCPRKTFSESERRYLSEPPKLTSLKDWSFDDAVETYLADQLPGRDALVGLNAYTVLLSGRQKAFPGRRTRRIGWRFSVRTLAGTVRTL